uniref:SirB2 family protein n=1 Tax=Granulosicoccus sp. 3-233 TaxID=3417969 RepID=UPI003D335E7B
MDYLIVKSVHQLAVTLSVSLFTLRALGSLAGARWPKRPALRISQHVNDSCLLLSALSLAVLSGLAPWNTPWLAVKILGLLIYIVLGTQVMREQNTLFFRGLSLVSALLVFGFIVSVAVNRSVAGFFAFV